MNFTREQRCLLWLSAAEITADKVRRMIAKRGSASALWDDFGRGIALTANAETQKVLQRFHHELAMDTLCERIEKLNVTPIFIEDEDYPPLLATLNDAPYVLYAKGNLSMLRVPAVAIVGTRYPSGYGRNMARSIAYGLCDAGMCVVSGMAKGIDGCAHEGALDAKGATVAVLGSGVNVPYPIENVGLYRKLIEGAGVVISEYPLDAVPQTYHFPHRNRVISGLSQGIVFVEGRTKSGGKITVDTALDQGREVFAVPGCVGQTVSEGPHGIIREGGRLVTCAGDILMDLGLSAKPDITTPKRNMVPEGSNPAQSVIIKALLREPMGMDALAVQTGLDADALMAELSIMEIMGQVRRDSGNMFAIAIGLAAAE